MKLVPANTKGIKPKPFLGASSIFTADVFKPRPDDPEEKKVWKCLERDVTTARVLALRDYITIIDNKMENPRVREHASFYRYLQLVAGFLVARIDVLCDVPMAMRPSPAASSAGPAPVQVERPPIEGAAGSAEPPMQAAEAPRVQKRPARAPRAAGSAVAPKVEEGAVPHGC